MDSNVEQFVDFASSLQFSNIRPESIHAAKRCLIDALGCAIGSFEAEPVVGLRRLASRVTSQGSSTLVGTRIGTSPDLAAFVNGSMTRYSDFNDDYFGTEHTTARGDTGPHPSDTIGAILAAAEAVGATGPQALLGVVLAYEVSGQLVDEVIIRVNGWDHPIFHAITSALAGGRLLGLNKDQLANALRLAVIPNVALYETRVGQLSHWKGLAGPNGSRNGLFAAMMAGEGITGPAQAFEGPRGFMRQLGAPFKLGRFGGGKQPFRIESTYFKSKPIRYELQAPVELALRLHNEIEPDQIASLKVFMDKRSLFTRAQDPSLWNPQTRETADHSGPYLIGASLVDGAISDETFTAKRFLNPAILSVVDRIEMVPYAEFEALFPWRMACRFEIELKAGEKRTYDFENAKGHPQNPMTDRDIEDKFFGQTSRFLSHERGQKLLDQIWALEKIDGIRSLFDLMCFYDGA